MKRALIFLFAIVTIFAFIDESAAQQNPVSVGQNANQKATPEEIANADLAITANVRAAELRFEAVPNVTVEFPGTYRRETVWEAERQNLPRPVQPGVAYRNIGIRLRITSRFADIERIVAEALGEIPVSDAEPRTNNPAPNEQNTPVQNNQAAAAEPKTTARKPQ